MEREKTKRSERILETRLLLKSNQNRLKTTEVDRVHWIWYLRTMSGFIRNPIVGRSKRNLPLAVLRNGGAD